MIYALPLDHPFVAGFGVTISRHLSGWRVQWRDALTVSQGVFYATKQEAEVKRTSLILRSVVWDTEQTGGCMDDFISIWHPK